MGVRFPAGYEFGIGPTAAVSQSEWGVQDEVGAADRRGEIVRLRRREHPLNLVFATNKDGTRLSIITGYAIQRASKDLGG